MKKDKIRLMKELKLEIPKKIKVSNILKAGVGLVALGIGLKALKEI